jgi:YVTN family beta-propeller protein
MQDSIELGQGPVGIDSNVNTNGLDVTNYRSGSLSVIDGSTNIVVDNVSLGVYPNEIVIYSNTNKLYVSHKIPLEHRGYSAIDVVSVIDGNTNIVVDEIKLDKQPFDITVDENADIFVNSATSRLYIVAGINATTSLSQINNGIDIPKGILYIIDTNTMRILNAIELISPRGVDINTNINRIYIINSIDKTIYSIDGFTNKLLNETVKIGGLPTKMAVNSDINKIYIVYLIIWFMLFLK